MAVWNRDLIVQKIDKVLGDTKQILTALSGGTGAVKSVQRGTARFTGVITADGAPKLVKCNIPLNINISTVNPKKCAVFINGCAFQDEARKYPVTVNNINANQISFTVSDKRVASEYFYSSETIYDLDGKKEGETVFSRDYFDWQLIEYY